MNTFSAQEQLTIPQLGPTLIGVIRPGGSPFAAPLHLLLVDTRSQARVNAAAMLVGMATNAGDPSASYCPGLASPGFSPVLSLEISRACRQAPCPDQLVSLVRQMWSTNPTWGSKRIQAELAKIGISLSDSTLRKYRPRDRGKGRDQSWKSFLHNHAKELISVDFFTVPTGAAA